MTRVAYLAIGNVILDTATLTTRDGQTKMGMFLIGTKVGLVCLAGEVKTIGTTMEEMSICLLGLKCRIHRATEKHAGMIANRRLQRLSRQRLALTSSIVAYV